MDQSDRETTLLTDCCAIYFKNKRTDWAQGIFMNCAENEEEMSFVFERGNWLVVALLEVLIRWIN